MMTFSEPLNEGIETNTEGGATAPMQNAEQALQVECAGFSASPALRSDDLAASEAEASAASW
jgi:hypothetical protein